MIRFDPTLRGPLDGVRVIDLSRLVAGNMLTLQLADFGADVIKVERPGEGDDLRRWTEAGAPIYWTVYGRNKRSLVLDLDSADGLATLRALLRVAEREGRGQVIDLSLFEPIFSTIASEAAKTRVTGRATMRAGNQSTHAAPRNVYACRDGGFVALSGSMQSMAMRIFDTIGRPELKTDPRFVDNTARVANRDALDAILGGFIVERTVAENLALFEAAGVTVGPVCDMAELLDHPYTRGREAIVEVEDASFGSLPMHNVVPRLGVTPGGFRRPAPALGEHTEEILAELARRG